MASSEMTMRKAIFFVKVLAKKNPKTPQKTYNQQEGSNQHNTAPLHSEISVQLTGVGIPATAEWYSLYFQLRQQLQHNI